jgi:hypothetical protein
MLPKVLPPGPFVYFERVRFYCNVLDYVFARMFVTPSVPFTVLPQ